VFLAENQYICILIKEDNKDIELRRYRSEMLRQNNEIVRLNSLISFLMEENKTIAEEERQKYLDEINCLKEALCESNRRNEEYEEGKRKDAIRIANLESQLSERTKKLEECSEYMKLANNAVKAEDVN